MNILGISAYYHDSAACLLQRGKIIAAAQEERFTRIRHDSAFPKEAVGFCLKQAGLNFKDIDLIAYYEKPFLKFERILESTIEEAPYSLPNALASIPIWIKEKLWLRKMIWKEYGTKIPILFCNHHESHAASSFFPSPFSRAATLTVDGVGEWSTTTWGVGHENQLELKGEIRYPHSLGLLYSALTQYLGFKVNSAEYKVMGLAPYGDPVYVKTILDNLIEIFPDGSYLLNLDYFAFHRRQEMITQKMDALFKKPRRNAESKLEKFHADVASSLQEVTEKVMLGLCRHVFEKTQEKNLCLAGGVALNCVANGRIQRESAFKNIWIQPGAGDSGGAVGAAYLAWHHYKKSPRALALPQQDFLQGAFLGPSYDDKETELALKKYPLQFKKCAPGNVYAETAQALAAQKIVGWFQGRMEFGPRALGSRSILGDARNPEMQRRMNLKIKFRESFRPFAPSVLEDKLDQYFDMAGTSPYMLLTCQVKGQAEVKKIAVGERWMQDSLSAIQSEMPAITHVDGSARVQTVDKMRNPHFHRLLEAFYETTGSPVLINTSFNVRGEPIVCSPEDAIRCFIKSDIDVLVIGNYLVERTDQPTPTLETLRNQFHAEDHFELD